MRKLSRLTVLTATAAIGLLVAGCASSAAPGSGGQASGSGSTGLQTVNVGQVQLSIFAPLYVADAKGYFRNHGIKLNLQTVKSGEDAVPLASSGKLDVVVAGFSAGMLNAIHSGLNISVVGSMGVSDGKPSDTPTALVGRAGKITSVAALKGKRVGVLAGAGGTSAYLTGLALAANGLSIKDVTLVNLGNPDMPTALANGSIDAGLMSAPFSFNSVKSGTGTSLWVPPAGTSGTGVVYGGQFAKSNLAQPFFDALAEGARDLQGQNRYSDQNVNIIAKATGQTPEKVKSVPLYTWKPNLAPLPDQLKAMERIWMQDGAISYTQSMPTDKYINPTFSQKAR